jgi:hypothetical protein
MKFLGKDRTDDEPIPFAKIVESNGLADAIWCLRSTPEYDKQSRLFAVWCARYHQSLLTDLRSLAAIDVAEKFANGEASEGELKAARSAARSAAAAAAAADAAAWDKFWEEAKAKFLEMVA